MKSTPDFCDAYEGGISVLEPLFTNFGGRERFYGEVVTVKCFEDNSKVKELAGTAGHNRVMVVDGGGSLRLALLGDMTAANALANGWTGFVIYGSIRDVDELGAMDLGVQALATNPMKTEKKGIGDVDVAVTFAGVTIHPGDFIACDNNGIVVSPVSLDV
jgi:regulator of ribonuclease activity A